MNTLIAQNKTWNIFKVKQYAVQAKIAYYNNYTDRTETYKRAGTYSSGYLATIQNLSNKRG